MQTAQVLSMPLLLLLALYAGLGSSVDWETERLQWLVVTKPNAVVQLNCTSDNIYPFTLLNDSSIIGAVGSLVKRIWWILPDEKQATPGYDDGNRQLVDRGVGLWVRHVEDSVHGLYHCAVEANTLINETLPNLNSTAVFYYKRGLNLYGADVYGGSVWEKYKRNTLIGSLTAGTFLALLAGYAVLNYLGIFAKCAGRSNAVDIIGVDSIGSANGGPVAADPAAAQIKAAVPEPDSASPERSMRSIRSRRSEKPADEAPVAETAA